MYTLLNLPLSNYIKNFNFFFFINKIDFVVIKVIGTEIIPLKTRVDLYTFHFTEPKYDNYIFVSGTTF